MASDLYSPPSPRSGIRPLAGDPHTKVDPNAPVSRDHVISHNPDSDIVFVAGGKWTTYREMAQDAVDKLIEVGKLKCTKACSTLTTGLVGKDGESPIFFILFFGLLVYADLQTNQTALCFFAPCRLLHQPANHSYPGVWYRGSHCAPTVEGLWRPRERCLRDNEERVECHQWGGKARSWHALP